MAFQNCSQPNTEDHNVTIELLNEQRVHNSIPTIIHVGVAIVLGIAGNSLVIFIYRRHFPKNVPNLFIIALAITDLITCAFGLPYEVVDLRYPYLHGHKLRVFCKISRLFANFGTINSGYMFLAISYDRYTKICFPLELFSNGKAKKIILLGYIFSIVFASPVLYTNDVSATITAVPGIVGYNCQRDFSLLFTSIYYLLHLFYFLVVTSTMIYLYLRIIFTLCVRNRRLTRAGLSSRPHIHSRSQNTQGECEIATTSSQDVCHTRHEPSTSVVDREAEDMKEFTDKSAHACREVHSTLTGSRFREYIKKSPSARNGKSFEGPIGGEPIKTRRLTLILVMITIACYASFVPLIVISVTSDIMVRPLCDDAIGAVLKFCSRSYVINSYINPIIYSSLNPKFREKLFSLWRS